jgi:hypothetical protein
MSINAQQNNLSKGGEKGQSNPINNEEEKKENKEEKGAQNEDFHEDDKNIKATNDCVQNKNISKNKENESPEPFYDVYGKSLPEEDTPRMDIDNDLKEFEPNESQKSTSDQELFHGKENKLNVVVQKNEKNLNDIPGPKSDRPAISKSSNQKEKIEKYVNICKKKTIQIKRNKSLVYKPAIRTIEAIEKFELLDENILMSPIYPYPSSDNDENTIDFEAISKICTNRDFRRNIRNNHNIWTLNTLNTIQDYFPFDITSSTYNTTMK